MALSAHTQRSRLVTREPQKIALPAAADAVIYEGAQVALNASGYAVPASDAAGLRAIGTCIKGIDNTGGANGTLAPPARFVEVDRAPFSYAIGGSPVAGATVYATDDDDLTTSAGSHAIAVGWLLEPDPLESGNWYVEQTGGFGIGEGT